MKPPTRDELMACKAREEAKREAYLRHRFTAKELWRWQQEALDALAKLRPEAAAGRRTRPVPQEPDVPQI